MNQKPKKIRCLKSKGKEIKINDEIDTNEKNDQEETDYETINSDAYELWKDINFNFGDIKKIKGKKIKKNEIFNDKDPVQKWKIFSKRLGLHYGINLIQTIKSIINAMNAILKENISLEEKIKYYNILTDKENEKIIKFLSPNQNDDDEEKNEEDDENV